MSNASSSTGSGQGERAAEPTSSPDAPKKRTGWSPPTAVALILVGFAVLPRIAEILLAIVPQLLLGWDNGHIERWFDSPEASFLYVLLAEGMTVGLLLWFIRRRSRRLAPAVGLRRPPQWNDLWRALGGVLVYFGVFVIAILLITHLVNLNTNQEQAIGFERDIHGSGLVLAFISLVVLPPLAEEVIFRGFFFGTLRTRKVPLSWSIFTTSLLFGTLHLFGSADGDLLWFAFIDTFILSLVLCYMRERTGAIWSSVIIHALKNGFVFLNLFVLHIS